MAIESKCSLNNMLISVLSVANQEQSMFYSPRIYSDQYNVVTSLLISALVKSYPLNPTVIDMLDPFVKIEIIPVKDGYVDLPEDYRDLLGSPYVFANPESNGECGSHIEPLTAQNFKNQILKGGCNLRAVIIYPESEFILRTRSTYDAPTWENPIGFFSGKRQIKVCPYNATKVAVMYVKKEEVYRYGYIVQPDDTFLFDATTTVESLWASSAFTPIFNAMLSLYSAYSKDQELGNWAQIITQQGIL